MKLFHYVKSHMKHAEECAVSEKCEMFPPVPSSSEREQLSWHYATVISW